MKLTMGSAIQYNNLSNNMQKSVSDYKMVKNKSRGVIFIHKEIGLDKSKIWEVFILDKENHN